MPLDLRHVLLRSLLRVGDVPDRGRAAFQTTLIREHTVAEVSSRSEGPSAERQVRLTSKRLAIEGGARPGSFLERPIRSLQLDVTTFTDSSIACWESRGPAKLST